MKKTGAWLVRYALEQLGIRYTFGIPGVHTTELYDELRNSSMITPLLVTHEAGGAFMADAVSRTSDETGTLLLVPAAGLSHAASGIGEAFLDGVPLLVISGGIRTDTVFRYQLHEVDNHAFIRTFCKATYKIAGHAEIISTVFKAFEQAHSAEPGPVYVEIPVNIQLDEGDVEQLPVYVKTPTARPDRHGVHKAAELLKKAKRPGLLLGWGAVNAQEAAVAIAEKLMAPVATTLQGLSAFPGDHALSVGMSFGPHAVPAAKVMEQCDVLLAVGTRFGEIATGSYGMPVPRLLIHIDINANVFHANFPATITIHGDSREILPLLLEQLEQMEVQPRADAFQVRNQIVQGRKQLQEAWLSHPDTGRVNPCRFFMQLYQQTRSDMFLVADDGNHTFLTAELMPVRTPKHFISPTDFNCMGYAVPAAIGVKLIHRNSAVVAIVGDGAFNMTCMELLTAVQQRLGVVIVVFADGELAQIAQAQEAPYRRRTCTQLPALNRRALAQALGAQYVQMGNDAAITESLTQALAWAEEGVPVIVEVLIDYSRPTCFTQGVLKTSLKRLNRRTQMRMVGRSLWRELKSRIP